MILSFRTAGALCMACSMLSLAACAISDDSAQNYAKEIALAKKAGLPTTPQDMLRSIPDSRNAGLLYQELDRALKAKPAGILEIDKMTLLSRVRPTPQQIARARSELNARKDLMALIHRAAALPDCDLQHRWSDGPAMLFPEFSRMRAATRWLMAESGLLLWDGKPLEAVRNAALGFRISAHSQTDQILIAHFVAIAIDAITLRGLENILYHTGGRPDVAIAVRSAVEQNWSSRSLAHSLRGEVLFGITSADMARKEGLGGISESTGGNGEINAKNPAQMTPEERRNLNDMIDFSTAWVVRTIRELMASADLPYPQARAACSKAEKQLTNSKDPRMALAAVVAPAYSNVPGRRAYDIAKARIVQSAAAVLAWKAKHGSMPTSLSAAVSPAPEDPFDLKPLRYRRIGNGFVIYSIGETGKFNGELADPRVYSREAVFRWPLPDKLKVPPVAASPPGPK